MNKMRVGGSIRPPGDKSISHRALILAALSRGKSRITHILDSADVRSTASCLRALGADIPTLSDDFYVTGKPSRFLVSPRDHLDCGNSGTTTRLLCGVIAGAGLTATLKGDASLSRRPMRRVAEPLRAMGAKVSLAARDTLPMTIKSGPLRPIEWESRVASAQVKSSILLAALLGGVQATVREPHLSRDHTERMLEARGVSLRRTSGGRSVEIEAGQVMRPEDIAVPADPSSAAFFAALAALSGAGELRLTDTCLNDTRTGFFDVLLAMGARLEVTNQRNQQGEIVGDLLVRPSGLKGIVISAGKVPTLIDELPLFACVASRAAGASEVRGAAELRVKESDRIATLVSNLRKLGAEAEELPDGFRVNGTQKPLRGRVITNGDHRIAMSFGILAAIPGNDIEIDDPDCVSVSYPGFWRDIGAAIA
jgi:3-phosphoshikimate 1-carboxyvinyltransferase